MAVTYSLQFSQALYYYNSNKTPKLYCTHKYYVAIPLKRNRIKENIISTVHNSTTKKQQYKSTPALKPQVEILSGNHSDWSTGRNYCITVHQDREDGCWTKGYEKDETIQTYLSFTAPRPKKI